MQDEDTYRLPADQLFAARLDKVEEKVINFTYRADSSVVAAGRANVGEAGQFVKWTWEFFITDGDHQGERAWGETPDRLTNREDNVVRQWAETLLGREIEMGEEFDTDIIIGLPCKITVRHEEPRPRKDGQGSFYGCPVADVLPAEDAYPF